MAERNEQLPHLSSPRSTEVEKPVSEEDSFDVTKRHKLNEPLNQWKLLKIIQTRKSNGYALSDLRIEFEIDQMNAQFLDDPLGQLIRGGQLKTMIGTSKLGKVGVLYVST